MNVSLNTHFEKFVEEVVASGRFKSSSEVIREGLRLLEEREMRIATLRYEIELGRRSGAPIPYDPEAVKARGREMLNARKG
ncbi:MAG: type II toxin-antitoxin system ParD family antitoxin [Alphaproteobacteria bacterium]|nr:type II toxin-antitoxin system ParD family antitoxin [Alphaproteobacteria bacterium]